MGTTQSALSQLYNELHANRKKRTITGVLSLIQKLNQILPNDSPAIVTKKATYRDVIYFLNVFANPTDKYKLLSLLRKTLNSKLLFTVSFHSFSHFDSFLVCYRSTERQIRSLSYPAIRLSRKCYCFSICCLSYC